MILAPYISTSENASANRSYDEFKNLVSTTNFRDGDIICLQDSLGTSTYWVDQVIEYIKSIKKAVKTNPKLKFWLDVENYQTDASENTVSASSNRFIDQLLIGSLYAENMISFSYLHYYDPLKDGISSEYNNSYKNYTFSYKTANLIDPPNGGSIYRDKNGDEAPIPAGFKVSSKLGENLIESGLVVEYNYGNQFVWIPIDGGIVSDGNYDYNIDGKMLEYKKWLSYSNLKDDELPNGVTSEEEQVKKYDGFYISRYEAMFDYNNGNIRVAIKPSKNNTQTEDWRSSRDKYHDGYLWNFITYSDAKYFSEKMSTAYSYNSSIKAGLVNGRQWDTIMRLLDLNNINIYNSVTWGNYDNSESPANTGNYIKGKLQNSGSNENWKAFNIYDMAGNLAEWTSEINSQNTEQSVYRSTDFSGNGMYGPVSYRAFSDTGDYAYPNIGFRVVMYLE